MTMCAIECGLGIGLIVTAGKIGAGAPATCVRLGAGLLFLVATSALIELRAQKPDVGCGCFGDFSTAPVSGRTMARSAFLAAAALSTIDLPPITPPDRGAALRLLATPSPANCAMCPLPGRLPCCGAASSGAATAAWSPPMFPPMSGASCAGGMSSSRRPTRRATPIWYSRSSCAIAARPCTPRWSMPAPDFPCRCPRRPARLRPDRAGRPGSGRGPGCRPA
jgi:hypothetical protein